MRKSENTPAAASRPATKPKQARRSGCDEKRDRIPDATRQAERAPKGGNRAPPFAGPARRRGRVKRCSGSARCSLRVPPAVGRGAGASLVIISQQKQTVAENAQARAHLKLGFPMLSDPGGRIAQRFGLRWCIPEPRNVGIEPHYYSAVGNLQGADHAICIHNDMDVVPNLQDITDSVFRIPPSRTPAR